MSTIDPHEDASSAPCICHRCGRMLRAGEGSFYVVRIEAFADPTGPSLTIDDLMKAPEVVAAEFQETLAELHGLSEQEMLDQVYRRLTLILCTPCYQRWIENPTG